MSKIDSIVLHNPRTREVVFVEKQEADSVMLEPKEVGPDGPISWVLHIGDEAFDVYTKPGSDKVSISRVTE